MTIPRDPMLHRALADVAHHDVDKAQGLIGGHPVGYLWHSGGDVPQAEQDALAQLEVVHLVMLIPAGRGVRIVCALALTEQGREVLSQWDDRYRECA